ncbi:MAG: hypothetical protein IJ275_03920 [Ruminococcus sp.]|nr:hypothetical protein [Ruminococcus sp.]
MKKLISIVLTLALVCGISVMGTSAAEINIAPTSTLQLFYSDEPYADITPMNGYVYGYIGDSDDDGDISVLDATAIQLFAAQLSDLSEDGLYLADVDFDDDISVLDATEIQLFVAQMSENPYISHTLYTDDYMEYTFDEIAYYLSEYGDYDSAEGYYCTYYTPTDVDDVNCTLMLVYYPDSDAIDFFMQYYQISTDTWVDTLMRVYRGDPVFYFGTELYDDYDTYFSSFGTSELVDLDNMTFMTECTEFDSAYYSNFDEVMEVVESQFHFTIAIADELLWNDISGYVTDIFW